MLKCGRPKVGILDSFGTVSLLIEFQERLNIEVSISDFDRYEWSTPNMIILVLLEHILKYISPVAWQHINFYGRYEFSKSPAVINLETIIASINEDDIITRLTQEHSLEEE